MTSRGTQIAPRTALSALSPGAASSPESSSPGITTIATSREWVLPPRPKPGRKPSIDTPASKRKAQNRAAQRAFRERRATRVQELEEKLLEVEKDKEVKEVGLVNTINKLKFENQFLIKSLDQLRLEFQSFRSTMSAAPSPAEAPSPPSVHHAYKAELNQSAQQLLDFAKLLPAHVSASPALLLYSVQQILPAPLTDSPPALLMFRSVLPKSRSTTQITPLSQKPSPAKPAADELDCGICLKDQCLCADVGLKGKQESTRQHNHLSTYLQHHNLEVSFELFTPMEAVSLGKKRMSGPKEMDFTSGFKKMPDLKRLRKSAPKPGMLGHFDENSPVENCGFCSDDTPCVCREAAKEAALLNQSLQTGVPEAHDTSAPMLLPPIQVKLEAMAKAPLPVMHPGPSLEIREFTNMTQGAVPTVVREEEKPEEEEKSGCTGNPGTCLQCQLDPMSTLFCTTVASKAALETKVKKPLPRTPSAQSLPSFVRSGPNSVSTPGLETPILGDNGIFIPCADAYKTLSRHKKFDSVDFLSLVGRLTTRGMLVEVQSVANVIRELDRKVYD